MLATCLKRQLTPAFLLAAICLSGCHGERKTAETPSVERSNFVELKAKHEKRLQKYHRDLDVAPTGSEAVIKIHKEFAAYWLPAIDEMLKVAEAEPSTSTGLEAAMWIINNCDSGYESHVRAAELLLANHPHPESLPAELYHHLYGYEPVYERLLRLGAESNPSRQAKAYATFELADLFCNRADFRNMMDATPELDRERTENFGAAVVQYLKSIHPDQDRAEAKKLYELIRQDDDIPYRNTTLGEVARERLLPFTQAFPEIGKKAPNIDAADFNGQRLTLESLRGKVVVVSFWASWCGPCLARVPEENELVQEFADTDFVFMGVNGDETLQAAQGAVEKKSIRFNSWWDNPEAKETIVARWGVRAWPTTFVVDRSGIIRFKDLSGSELRRAIRELLESAKSTAEEIHH